MSSEQFSGYEHMENHYNVAKHYMDPNRKEFIDPQIEWVATEKVHGTNYSFLTDGVEVTPCKRGSSLGNDRSYFGHGPVFMKHKNEILTLFQAVSKRYEGVKTIQLYGELFGGLYNHKTDAGYKVVQKGINYCPFNDFMAYDLKVTISDDKQFYIAFNEHVSLLSEIHSTIKLVPIIARGTLSTLLELNPKFESEVYKVYNLPRVEGNYAEGFVLHPADLVQHVTSSSTVVEDDESESVNEVNTTNTTDGAGESVKYYNTPERTQRIAFKFKNPDFNEVMTKPTLNTKDSKKPQTFQQICFENLKLYVTQNRFDNLVTKLTDDEDKNILISMMYEDIVVDFLADIRTAANGETVSEADRKANNTENVEANKTAFMGFVKGFVLKRIYK